MQCKNCGVENDVDSKFCKECGHKTEQTDKAASPPQDEHVRIGELIYTAYKSKEAGRLEDAILACQGALALNKSSASAHSLLGSLYELRGDIAAAMREYEIVLALAPESQLERAKLDDLRLGRLSSDLMSSEKALTFDFKKNAPIIVAVGLFLIVVVISTILFKSPSTKAAKSEETPAQPTVTAPVIGNVQPGQYPTQQDGQTQPGQAVQQPYQIGQQPASGQVVTQPQQPATNVSAPAPQSNRTSVQRSGNQQSGRTPYTNTAPTNLQVRPIDIPRSPNIAQPQKEPPVIVPVITPNEGHVSITRSPSPPPVAVDPEEKALKLQSQGKYQDAVNAYKEALPKTNDQGRIYQSMALCQQRLGQSGQAVDNYSRAIKAYKDQLAAGRDASEVQRNIRACEAGIQVNKD